MAASNKNIFFVCCHPVKQITATLMKLLKIVVKGGHIVGIFGMYAEDIQLGVGSSAHIVIQELSIDLIAQYSL